MAIVKMKKLSLLASRADREDLLRDLMLMGCVEVSEPDELLEDAELSALVGRENADLESYGSDYAALARGLGIIMQYVPTKTSIFAAKPLVSDDRLLDEKDTETSLALANSLEALDGKIRRLTSEESNILNLIESLTPWESLQLPLNSEGTSIAAVILGAVASAVDIEILREQLREAAEESEVFLVSSNREQHYLCVVCLRDKQTAVSEVLRRFGFSVTSLKNLRGTAEHNINGAKERLREIAKEKAELEAQIVTASEQKEALRLCYDHIGTKIARAEAAEKMLGTEYSLLLTGWMTAPSEADILAALSKYNCAWDISDPSPDEYPNVPVELNNNPLTRPLSMVTEMYSLPAYGSVDPNPLMMPFFVLFYGLMMADMGYGLIMMIFALLVKRKKPRGGMRNFFDLMLLCGISTFIVGAITGGFFGDAPAQLAVLFGALESAEDFVMPYPILFNALTDTTRVLVGAFVLGGVHVLFGMGIAFVKNIKDGRPLDAIFDIGSWWVLFAGIALYALGVTWVVAIVGVAMIVLTGGRSKKNIFGKLFGGIGKLYDITAYFGDILSYSRLMALMLAGGVIAQVFNTLGVLTGNVITFLLIFIIGHALNFGLNLLGCFVHDMRLQCLEFFGKFYEDGGRPFKPLSVKTKYNEVVNEQGGQ